MRKIISQCQCHKITVYLDLTVPLEQLTPRACDCDFCMDRSALWLSHPESIISIGPKEFLKTTKQGSRQATFWSCKECCDLIAVSCEIEHILKGALNSNILNLGKKLQDSVVVSPKNLNPDEKTERWHEVWGQIEMKTDSTI